MATSPASQTLTSQGMLDVLIRAGLIIVLVIFSYRVFYPFLNLLLWSMILAVTMYPLHLKLKAMLGGKDGRAATLIVLLFIALLLVPIYLLGSSIAGSVQHAVGMIRGGGLHVPPPDAAVAGWPVIGDSVYALWQRASTDLAGVTEQYQPQLKAAAIGLLGKLAGFASGLLLFIVAVILAGIFMAWGESGHRSAVHAATRVSGPVRGPQMAALCTATIRAVAQGVIGIAFIQMFLVGIAFILLPVPAAGFLCVVVLFLGIIQVPATIVTIPVIAYVISTQGARPRPSSSPSTCSSRAWPTTY
jgi:predicted PurR-regulated permease PerM